MHDPSPPPTAEESLPHPPAKAWPFQTGPSLSMSCAMKGLSSFPALALAALFLMPAIAAAQAGSNAELPLPPAMPAPGKDLPDFNGVWTLPYTPDLARAYRKPLPFTPSGETAFKKMVGGDDPHGFCQPTGPSRAFHSPFPFAIVQTAGMTTVLFEIDHTFMRIYTDGRGHPRDQDITWWGDAIGKYDGNKLTVDITGISDRSWLDTAGHQHSD